MSNTFDNNKHLRLNARPELLAMVSSISDAKNIKEHHIFDMMQDVLGKIAQSKYGYNYDIRVKIHKSNGAIVVEKVTTVVDEVEDECKQISLAEAQKIDPNYKVGDEIIEELPPLDFTRSTMQRSSSALSRSIKELEKKNEFESYKDHVGELISGVVKRTEYGNVWLDLGNGAEGFLHRNQTIAQENLNVGSIVRALIVEAKENFKGPHPSLCSQPN